MHTYTFASIYKSIQIVILRLWSIWCLCSPRVPEIINVLKWIKVWMSICTSWKCLLLVCSIYISLDKWMSSDNPRRGATRVRLDVGVAHGSSSFSDSGGWSQITVIWCLRPVLLAFKPPSASSQQRQQHWLFQSIPPAIATVAFLWYTLLY